MLLYADLSGSPPVGFPDLNLRTKHLACLAELGHNITVKNQGQIASTLIWGIIATSFLF